MNKFCHNCGKQLPAIGSKFCPFCGTSLASLDSKPEPIKPAKQTTFTPFSPNRDEDDEYVDHIDHLDIRINALEFEVSSANQQRPETIKDIAYSSDSPAEPRPPLYTNTNAKQVQEDFLKEAGTLR